MKSLRGLMIASLAVAMAGAVAADARSVSWEQMNDAALRMEVDRLVGPDAVDCGFVDIRKRKVSEAVKRQSLECIADAQRRGRPLKFGIARLPLGHDAYEVYARTADGQSWLLSHGRNALEDVAKSWKQRCLLVEASTRTLLISGMDCADAAQIGKESD